MKDDDRLSELDSPLSGVESQTLSDTFGLDEDGRMDLPHQTDDLDPADVATAEQFAVLLRRIHVRAGKMSYRQLEDWADTQRKAGRSDVWLTRSAISEALTGKRVPSRKFLINFLEACEVQPAEQYPWLSAWERIANTHRVSDVDEVALTDTAAARLTAENPHAIRSSIKQASDRMWSFLCWLGGADVRVLTHCPQERRKFTGLGGLILTTAVMAVVSAIVTANRWFSAPMYIAVPLGVAWGLAVMNLDRWMVIVSERRDRWSQNVMQTLPRFFLALILGVVISTPLVLWIFNSEVEQQLTIMQIRATVSLDKEVAEDPRFAPIPKLQEEVLRLQKEVDSGDPSRREVAAAELATTRADLKELETDQRHLFVDVLDVRYDGLLTRLDALGQLTSHNGALRLAYLTLLLFLTSIEVLPVIAKMLMNLGPPSIYDQICQSVNEASLALARAKLDYEVDNEIAELRSPS